jgi:hypothetical protein
VAGPIVRPVSRLFAGFVLSAISLVALAEGCQDPTQVTLKVTLDRKKASCSEISAGTAITVGVLPFDTERRLETGFVSAKTTSCDDTTGDIGTLVVTPSDKGKGSVIVVVGYKGKDPATCRPPLYTDCIVARRFFAFADHTRLVMPITIDPDCANVPCDAFSTCSKGTCFSSDTSCSGAGCEIPGELPDGGVDEASVVDPDASGFGDGSLPPEKDGGPTVDGGSDSGPTGTYCQASNTLVCSGTPCTPTGPACCVNNGGTCALDCPQPPSNRYCCTTADCAADQHCDRGASPSPGACVSNQPPIDSGAEGGTPTNYPYCTAPEPNGTLVCNSEVTCTGVGQSCCTDFAPGPPICRPGLNSCMGQTRYCCQGSDCASNVCLRMPDRNPIVVGPSAGTCMP